jgi:uncharacterized RDD family membrane protein YckC
MKSHRSSAALLCLFFIGSLTAALAAQAPAPGPAEEPRRALPVSLALGAAHPQEPGTGEPFRLRQMVVRVGQDYAVRANEDVGDVRVVLGDVTIEGRVDGDVAVVLGDVHARSGAVVDGSLVVVGGSATIDPGVRVNRDLVIVGGTLSAPPGFSPGNDHVVIATPPLAAGMRTLLPWLTQGLLWGRLIVPDLLWVWIVVAVTLLVYLALNTLLDGPVRASAEAILEKPVTVFFAGLLVLLLTVPVIVVLAASVVGLVVVPFLLAGLVVAVLLGKAGVARAIGSRLVAETPEGSRLQSLRSFLIGSVVILLAYLVPIVGIVTWALTGVVATGAAAVMLRRRLRREHPARERAVPAPVPPAPSLVEPQPLPAAGPSLTGVSPAPARGATDAAASATESAGEEERPRPAEGTADLALFPRATFLDRVAAFALDCLLVGISVGLLNLSRYDGAFPLLLFAYHVAFWAWKGTTLGGIIVGLEVIRTQGTTVRFADALVRGLSSLFSLFALGIGCFWMIQDRERQMWHDKIAGTLVVKVPREALLA